MPGADKCIVPSCNRRTLSDLPLCESHGIRLNRLEKGALFTGWLNREQDPRAWLLAADQAIAIATGRTPLMSERKAEQ